MSYERILKELESLKRKVERLSAMDAPQAFNPAVLDDYLLEADAALLYLGKNAKANDSDKLDGLDSTNFSLATHNHDTAYLGITAKAADSDKLDGIDSTGFATATHNHDAAYLGITAKAADSDKLDGKDSTDFVDKTTFDSGWTSYTPTFDGWTGTVNNVCEYKTIGKTCIVRINITSGTSDSTDGDISTATLPFKSRNVANLTWDGACGECADNGTILTTPCRWKVLPNSNIVSFYKDMNVGAWTKSGTKYQKAIIIYEIA